MYSTEADHTGAIELIKSTGFNPTADVPDTYHNNLHMEMVAQTAYQLAMGVGAIGVQELRALMIAAYLHDVNHTLDPAVPDRENIDRALKFVDVVEARFPHAVADWGTVRTLIRATCQPLDEDFIISNSMGTISLINVLLDADILSALQPESLPNVIHGLPSELGFEGTTAEWVEKNNQFLTDYRPRSNNGVHFKNRHLSERLIAFTEAAR
jgi:hypothetical protein